MRLIAYRSSAVISTAGLLLGLASSPGLEGYAATRPQAGGTLRVETRGRVASLDPGAIPASPAAGASAEKLTALVFERLTSLDEQARPQPALAADWQHDEQFKRWQFRLRPGVKFHDGTLLSPEIAAEALRASEPAGASDRQIRASADGLVIQSERPMPQLLSELARGNRFIFRAMPAGPVGTGPFRIAEWEASRRLVLVANAGYWGGRPFVDAIEVQFGVSTSQQVVDLELGKADVIEVAPQQMRRAAQAEARTSSSASIELLALVFDAKRPAAQDTRRRQAIALSIDRAAIWNVLLQKQGEIAGGLLPQWLSGYAFLFSTAADVARARQLRAEATAAGPLLLGYDSGDAEAKAVAERVAINAREAGFAMRVTSLAARSGTAGAVPADGRIVRVRLEPGAAGEALAALAAELQLSDVQAEPAGNSLAAVSEQLFARERALLEPYRVVPLVYLPESYGLSPRVRNWTTPRWGGWRLADVWLAAPPARSGGER